MKLTTKSDDSISRFLDLIQRGIDAWTEAAKIARAELEKDPEWAERVAEKNRFITAQAIHRLAGIGLKYIPQLAISECPGAKRLRNLPLALQEKCYTDPVPLLVNNNGDWEILQVDLHNLTPDQASQVFANDHVRSEGEQRAWIEDRKAKEVSPPMQSNLPYRISGNKCVVMVPTTFSAKDLAGILAEIS